MLGVPLTMHTLVIVLAFVLAQPGVLVSLWPLGLGDLPQGRVVVSDLVAGALHGLLFIVVLKFVQKRME